MVFGKNCTELNLPSNSTALGYRKWQHSTRLTCTSSAVVTENSIDLLLKNLSITTQETAVRVWVARKLPVLIGEWLSLPTLSTVWVWADATATLNVQRELGVGTNKGQAWMETLRHKSYKTHKTFLTSTCAVSKKYWKHLFNKICAQCASCDRVTSWHIVISTVV